MYIHAETSGDEVLVWERKDGERELKRFRAPLYFYVPDEDGEFESIYGDRLKKLEFSSKDAFKEARQKYQSQGTRLFESDIPSDLKILSEKYHGQPSPKLNITFWDIEVDYDETVGFSSVDNPYAPISSIALYHQWKNEYVLLAVPPDNSWTEEKLRKELVDLPPMWGNSPKLSIYLFKKEKDLLLDFLAEIEDSDVICGFNSEWFDDPMTGKRIEKVLGPKYLRLLSFPHARKPRWKQVERMGRNDTCLEISGRISADYLKLIRKYEVVERQSYKLESIAEDKLPHLPKLQYEGNLARLYRENFAFFARYNLRDTEILYGFEEKMAYVSLANEMFHLSTGLFSHCFGTLKLSDLSIINYCHFEMNKIVPDGEDVDGDDSIQGAFVLDPKVGMHDWVGAVDINSLYPSSIRSINISPETLIGQFDEKEDAQSAIANETDEEVVLKVYENGQRVKKTGKEWKRILRKNKWSVSGYGTVFDQAFKGVIPAVLEDWFNMRKQYRAEKSKYDNLIDELKRKYDVAKT